MATRIRGSSVGALRVEAPQISFGSLEMMPDPKRKPKKRVQKTDTLLLRGMAQKVATPMEP